MANTQRSGHTASRVGLIEIAIARPITTLVGVVFVILFGYLSVIRLPIQLTPDITVPVLTVRTDWNGASPAEIESEILEPQEEALQSTPGLVSMRSDARPDRGEITLELEVGTSLDEALVRVSNRLTQVPNYPLGARNPVVRTSGNAGPPLAVISIRAPDGAPVDAYRTWVEQDVLPQLQRIPGVSDIRQLGGRDTRLHIDFDPAALASRGLTVRQLATAVQSELSDVSAGDLTLGKRSMVVRLPLAPARPETLQRVVLGSSDDGTPILLGDVAKVSTGLRESTGVAFSDDRPSIVLLMFREVGTNVLVVSDAIRTEVDRLQEEEFAPEGLEIEVISDQTGYIRGALKNVRTNLLIGAVLAVFVLIAFLRSLRASAVVALSIPVCVFGTALGMAALGRTVNIVSLAGTAFAVGMVVDNSIVVLEAIDTWRSRASTGAEAALNGVREVWGAILASTLTTAAVFLPILAWRDEVGELLSDVAAAIAFAVLSSLVVSVLVIPSLAAWMLKPKKRGKLPGEDQVPTSGLARLVAAVVRRLTATRVRAFSTVLIAVVVTGGSALALIPSMEYLPTGDRNLIFGILVPPPGYDAAEMDDIGRFVQGEQAKHTLKEVDGVPAIKRSFFVGDPTQVFMGAVADDPSRAGELTPHIQELQSRVPGVFGFATQASLFATRLGGGRAVELEVSAPDLEQMVAAGGRLMGALNEAILDAQVRPIPTLELGAPELHAIPRRDEAAGLQLPADELGLVLDSLVDGAFIGEYGPEGRPKIDVILRARGADGTEIGTVDALKSAPVATPNGSVVPLSTLADIEERMGPTRIQRIERKRAITLQVSPPKSMPLEDAIRTIREDVIPRLRQEGALDGVDLRISGTAGKLEAAQRRFVWVLLLAVVISYLLLAALFEHLVAPIVVLVTLPLAAAGGVIGLRVVDRILGPVPFDLMTALGFLILIGVVVNNAILVVDGALARLREGQALADAVPDAVKARVRPILMSTLTSIAGLVPLVLSSGSGGELYKGVGAVVLGGLALSTVLTLFVVPSLFTLLWGLRDRPTPAESL